MRILQPVVSITIFCAGVGAALALASLRYDGDARRELGIALALTAAASAAIVMLLPLAVPETGRRLRIAVYAVAALALAAFATVHEIGFDGILPRHDGGQSVGLGALAANPDLFALVIAACGIAGGRRFGARDHDASSASSS